MGKVLDEKSMFLKDKWIEMKKKCIYVRIEAN
jgi:hypothetical protein